MAGSKSDYLEAKMIRHVLGGATAGQTYTPPATVYLALFTVSPGDDDSGTEVTGGAYVRQGIANTLANWPTGAPPAGFSTGGTTVINANAVTFPQATADWGLVVSFGLYDAATGGNLMYWADLVQSLTINSGSTLRFAPGDLSFTED